MEANLKTPLTDLFCFPACGARLAAHTAVYDSLLFGVSGVPSG